MDNRTSFLLSCLNSRDKTVWKLALEGLANSREPGVFEIVLGVCQKRGEIREHAFHTLLSLFSPEHIPAVLRYLNEDSSENWEMKLLAIGLLSHLPHPEATAALLGVIEKRGGEAIGIQVLYEIAEHIMRYIREGKEAEAENVIRDTVRVLCSHYFSGPYTAAQGVARWCLLGIGPRAVRYLIEEARNTQDGEKLKAIIESLGDIGGEEAVNFLLQFCSHPQEQVRAAATRAIGLHISQGIMRV